MDVSTVSGTNTAVAAGRTTSRGFDELSSEDFFALMIEEMRSQDPLDPQDTGQLLSELSDIRQMEQTSSSNKVLEELTDALQALTSGGRAGDPTQLIGHYVAGPAVDANGQATELRGLVVGVRFNSEGKTLLELHNGQALELPSVEQITLVENLPPEILAELEGELGEGDAAATARVATSDPIGGKPTLGDHVRDFGNRTDVVAELLDSLFAPVGQVTSGPRRI